MKAFTIDSLAGITAWPTRKAADEANGPVFTSQDEMDRVFASVKHAPVEVWNGLPGVTPVKKFTTRAIGIARIWKAIQSLTPAEPRPGTEQEEAPTAPRADSKKEQVFGMLQRPNGATLDEIMTATGWQAHTVRGFIAGQAAKSSLTIESFKDSAGRRTYRMAR